MAFVQSRKFRALLAGGVLLGLLAAAGAIAFHHQFLRDLPDLRRIEDYSPPVTSVVLDRQGRVIGEFYEEQRRLVPIGEIPRHVQLAFVAAEDKSFFEHKGIDYTSIMRAALANLRAGGEIKQGASTITQQMVKSLLLTPERTFKRKFREMILVHDRQLAQGLDCLWFHVHSGAMHMAREIARELSREISRGTAVSGVFGAVQITNDYPAGPSIDEMLPTLQVIQEQGCLILRKFTLDQLDRVIDHLSPKGLAIEVAHCGTT